MVVPRFVGQAIAGGPITVYGDGEQIRCFMHVHDLIDVLCDLAANDEAVGQIFNVGSDAAITINELAQKVRAIVNPDAEIVHIPYGEAYTEGFEDIRYRVPDVGKLQALTGFEPGYDLDGILRDVEAHLRGEADPRSGGRP
jgi:UDP-glucose 4-epimerase